ncbi:MAG TPA: hypothetical protein VK845_14450 [Gemmatimonadales bacterium]|nr:hypothetical protein [Gemmatimonadales bacterium]
MKPGLIFRIAPGVIRVEAYRGPRRRLAWTGEAPYESLADITEGIAAIVAAPEVARCAKSAWVEMERPLVQVRTLRDLPPVKASALPALIEHQCMRYFRRNGNALVTDAEWTGPKRGSQRVARAAAADLPLVEAIIRGSEAAGLAVERVGPALVGRRLDLSPPDVRKARRRRAWTSVRRLGWTALAMWSAVGVIYTAKLVAERRRVSTELATLEEPARALLGLRREVNDVRLMLQTVEGTAAERGTTITNLGRAAVALPDSSYLTSFSIDSMGAGRLSGSAQRAVAVVAALEREGAVVAPRLEGRPVKEALFGREWERFTVRFGEGTGP